MFLVKNIVTSASDSAIQFWALVSKLVLANCIIIINIELGHRILCLSYRGVETGKTSLGFGSLGGYFLVVRFGDPVGVEGDSSVDMNSLVLFFNTIR